MKTFHFWPDWLLGSTLLSDPYQTASARPGPPALIQGKTLTASPVPVDASLTCTGGVQEMERAGRVGCADVEVDAVGGAAVAGFATRRLEHLARDLVDRRVAVRAKRRVHRAGAGRHFVARGVDVVEPIQAHDPLGPAVRTRTDDVVVCLVDQRGRADVCRLVRR